MSFKESIEADNKRVFLNPDEFAERRTVKYDGNVYKSISVILTKTKMTERKTTSDDYMQGVHLVSAICHISIDDLKGNQPEQNQSIYIEDGRALGREFFRRYRILTSDVECGMVVLELESYDE